MSQNIPFANGEDKQTYNNTKDSERHWIQCTDGNGRPKMNSADEEIYSWKKNCIKLT